MDLKPIPTFSKLWINTMHILLFLFHGFESHDQTWKLFSLKIPLQVSKHSWLYVVANAQSLTFFEKFNKKAFKIQHRLK